MDSNSYTSDNHSPLLYFIYTLTFFYDFTCTREPRITNIEQSQFTKSTFQSQQNSLHIHFQLPNWIWFVHCLNREWYVFATDTTAFIQAVFCSPRQRIFTATVVVHATITIASRLTLPYRPPYLNICHACGYCLLMCVCANCSPRFLTDNVLCVCRHNRVKVFPDPSDRRPANGKRATLQYMINPNMILYAIIFILCFLYSKISMDYIFFVNTLTPLPKRAGDRAYEPSSSRRLRLLLMRVRCVCLCMQPASMFVTCETLEPMSQSCRASFILEQLYINNWRNWCQYLHLHHPFAVAARKFSNLKGRLSRWLPHTYYTQKQHRWTKINQYCSRIANSICSTDFWPVSAKQKKYAHFYYTIKLHQNSYFRPECKSVQKNARCIAIFRIYVFFIGTNEIKEPVLEKIPIFLACQRTKNKKNARNHTE